MNTEKRLYLIAITLPEALNRKILAIKQEIAREFQSKHSLRLPAHVTLQKPFHFTHEPFLIDKMTAFRTNLPGFEMQLNGYGAFIPKVIYVAVEKNEYLETLYRQLRNWLLSEAGFEPNWVSKGPFVPHVTVAHRDLTKQNFANAWKVYKARKFSANFIFNAIDLWRHNGKHWQIIRRFSPCEN